MKKKNLLKRIDALEHALADIVARACNARKAAAAALTMAQNAEGLRDRVDGHDTVLRRHNTSIKDMEHALRHEATFGPEDVEWVSHKCGDCGASYTIHMENPGSIVRENHHYCPICATFQTTETKEQ